MTDSSASEPPTSKKAFGNMPDAFVILFVIILIAGALSHIMPAGKYTTVDETVVVNGEQEIKTRILRDSFEFVSEHEGKPLFASGGEAGVLNYAFEGLVSGSKWGSAVGVVAFILVVGGAFGIIMKSGAINNGIVALIDKTKGADLVLIPLIFLLFSLGGAIFGMGEEAIAFCIILVPLVIALGYDAITGVLITYVATQIGFATSWMNPFSVAIAQGIADVPIMSGQGFRMTMWVVFTLIGLGFTMIYAQKVKRNPESSLCKSSNDYFKKQQFQLQSEYTHLDTAILSIFLLGIIWVIWGVTVHEYYIPEIATQFFIIGVVIGIASCFGKRMNANGVSDAFQQGAKDLLPAALIVGMAKGIVIILGGDDVTQASTLNTILYYASSAIEQTSAHVNAVAMLLFQGVFNFFVASGSGQAAITMPLMAPLSDLVGVSRQIAVLAFQLGDGLSNIIIPTSASLIGCLGVARIDWALWLKFIWKFFLLMTAISILTVLVAVSIGFS